MEDKPYDVLTIAEELKHLEKLDQAGGEAYLFELAHDTPSAANVMAYAAIVKKKSNERKFFNCLEGAKSLLEKGGDLPQVLYETTTKLNEIATPSSSEPKLVCHSIQDFLRLI